MITDIEDYFSKGCGRCDRFDTPECSTRLWEPGLLQLRDLCREYGLGETVKWGQPCYVYRNRNIAIIGAFRGDFRLTFFDAALLKDSDVVLERSGPNTRHPNMLRFSTPSDVSEREPTIRTCLTRLIDCADAGLRPAREALPIEIPAELEEAMKRDPELAAAFAALTPGRQRSYVVNLNSAKKSETRFTRIAKFRSRILAGKGALER